MGAWIETVYVLLTILTGAVAPHVGAWIETYISLYMVFPTFVAPHVGAWIETKSLVTIHNTAIGRTPRGCVD